jgi:NAD(P)-dependent dehydrogenase (short-subunit alcohol dehydrogenase family)
VAALTRQLGGIDVVVANAGIAAFGPVACVPPETLERVVAANLTGVVRPVAATLPHVSARRGHYLFVSSASSFLAAPGLAVYAATKSGVEHFAATLRYEVAHRGVTVGTVHPSWIDTDLLRGAQADVASFREILDRLPWPLNIVTPADACAARMVDAIERRARTTYVPRVLAPLSALRHVLARPPFDWLIRGIAATAIPAIEREMGGPGRVPGSHPVDGAPGRSGGIP